MPGTELTVHVNRGSANTLEAERDAIETTEQFSIVLSGHERPAHVHCRLDGDLDRVATIDQSNYYIPPDDVTAVPVDVDPAAVDDPVDGTLEVVTGYGSESVTIAVTVSPPSPGVDVDESLSVPDRSEPDPGAVERTIDRLRGAVDLDAATVGVVCLALFAIAIAVATAATVGSFVATGGLVIVVAGVLVALWLVLW